METRPQETQPVPGFDPEVDHIFSPETCESGFPGRCRKAASNHDKYIPFNELDLQHLPAEWRHQDILQHIRDIGQRVVKLRVRGPLSPARPVKDPRMRKYSLNGTGFLTYDDHLGAPVIHTNRHVVYDPYEASRTDVVFFYEGDKEGIQCAGSSHCFRCSYTMDYSVFTLQQPLPEAVVTWQNGPMTSCESDNQDSTKEAAARKAEQLDKTFSMPNKQVFELTCSEFFEPGDDVVIISHPHGNPKQVSVGKFSEQIVAAFTVKKRYTTPTCAGSSGAPLLKFNSNTNRPLLERLRAGHNLHQGDFTSYEGISTGIGHQRQPVGLFSYGKMQDAGRLGRLAVIFFTIVSFFAQANDEFVFELVELILFNILFSILMTAGILVTVIFFLAIFVRLSAAHGPRSLRFTVYFVLFLSVHLATSRGVAVLLERLDKYDLIRNSTVLLWSVFISYFLLVSWARRPRVIRQVEDRFGRWVETLVRKLRGVCRLCRSDRLEEELLI